MLQPTLVEVEVRGLARPWRRSDRAAAGCKLRAMGENKDAQVILLAWCVLDGSFGLAVASGWGKAEGNPRGGVESRHRTRP